MNIYHKDVGFPATLKLAHQIQFKLSYSKHAVLKGIQIMDDSIVPIKLNLPRILYFKKTQIIEIHTNKNQIKKIVVRKKYNSKKDIIFVLEKQSSVNAKVITFWFNNPKDNHPTLDKTKYTKP